MDSPDLYSSQHQIFPLRPSDKVIKLIAVYVIETLSIPFFQLPDLIGAIGGHLGLWIGMSIVSFLEVFELIGSIFGACCRMLCCRRKDNVINVKGS